MIKICGHMDLDKLLSEQKGKYNVILFTNSELGPLPFVRHNAKEWIHLPVDDVDHYEYNSMIAIKPEDVKNALEFSVDKEDLVCACHVGVSRSSAMAYLVGCKREGTRGGLGVIEKGKHFPNRLIVYIGSMLLKSPDVWDRYVEFYKDSRAVDPSQSGSWPTAYIKSKIIIE